jgi:hypothetical protein
MKRLFITGSFFYVLSSSLAQSPEIKMMVDSLKFIKADTFNCNADIFWRIIAKDKAAIPFLIEKLTDTTPTTVRFHCKKSKLNVGEVAHFALIQIAEFPAFMVTKIQFDVIDNDCWTFYDEYLFINANKPHYQKCVREWYEKEKLNYRAKQISKKEQTQCQKKFKIDTFLKWKEN